MVTSVAPMTAHLSMASVIEGFANSKNAGITTSNSLSLNNAIFFAKDSISRFDSFLLLPCARSINICIALFKIKFVKKNNLILSKVGKILNNSTNMFFR